MPVLVAVERRDDRSGRIRLVVLPDFFPLRRLNDELRFQAIALDPDGARLAGLTQSADLVVLDFKTGKLINKYPGMSVNSIVTRARAKLAWYPRQSSAGAQHAGVRLRGQRFYDPRGRLRWSITSRRGAVYRAAVFNVLAVYERFGVAPAVYERLPLGRQITV